MTVADLIADLQALPQDLPVVTYDDDGRIMPLLSGPRIAKFYRYSHHLELFDGEPDDIDRHGGACEPFENVALGISE